MGTIYDPTTRTLAVRCAGCGARYTMTPAAQHGEHVYFGSDADYCRSCGKCVGEAEIVERESMKNSNTLTPAARRALEDLRRPGWYADETSSHKTAAIINSYACSERRVLRATIDELVEAGLVKFGGYTYLGLSRWVAV